MLHCDVFPIVLGAMDSFARGLKSAVKLIEEGKLSSLVKVQKILRKRKKKT